MLSNIFTKTIYEKRWMMLTWTVGLIAMVAFTMIFYPTLSKSFGDALLEVPDSLKTLIGDASAYTTIDGYVNQQIIMQMPFLTLILSVILFSGLLAGDENEGTLQSLMVQPVSRAKIYFQKVLAGGAILAVAVSGVFFGTVLGLLLINESVSISRLVLATVATWLVSFVFGIFAYMLAAITGKRGLSGSIAGALAFVAYLITSLVVGIKALRGIEKFSPFHYYNSPPILKSGVDWADVFLLLAACLLMVIVGYWRYSKRDVYQR